MECSRLLLIFALIGCLNVSSFYVVVVVLSHMCLSI